LPEGYEEPASQEFYDGYVLGFHRIVSLMQQHALAFGIELKDLQLEGIEPDRDFGIGTAREAEESMAMVQRALAERAVAKRGAA
jgi:hypothetical protein